ncbi:hypothetical protein [Bacillus sp. RAR_GA_16]|uniref:hypothetical protein n=1 Tax=Bacillus sp. RAR_GA_16 TaxID=2876774 RepID=UPI001CCF2B0D|nr:hypothetical protein [Bacillus sp. RAR_GA_16]MCA0172707.1 hypothetical protein [Bacillus sp. RAR_GA_16]
MGKAKHHFLTIINLFISAVAMGFYAFTMVQDNKIGYFFTFLILGFFFIVLAIYGMVRNHKLAQSKENH